MILSFQYPARATGNHLTNTFTMRVTMRSFFLF
nr:MAG TPA: hypothetical protein [Caudoviricetes sp.]